MYNSSIYLDRTNNKFNECAAYIISLIRLNGVKGVSEENLNIFKTVRTLFDLENPKSAPIFESFKTTAKRQDL